MRKLAGAFLIFIVCVLFGGVSSENLRKRMELLSFLLSDLKTLRNGLKSEKLSVGNMVSELSESGNIKEFWLEMKKGTDLNFSFGDAYLKGGHIIEHIGKKELEAFKTFARDFGKSDLESEIIRLDMLIEKLGEAEKTLKKEYPKKIKLTRSLSALGGIALMLLLM